MKKVRKSIVAVLMVTGIMLSGFSAFAAESDFTIISPKSSGGIVSDVCIKCGACTVCDLMSVLSKTLRFLLGISGALALALFMWGAFTLLTSAGAQEKVEEGKKVLTGTTIALVIILLMAWMWPRWVVIALKGMPVGTNNPTIFSDEWWLTPCRKNDQNLGAQCNNEPSRQPNQGSANKECYDEKTAGPLPAGSPCNDANGKPDPACVCKESGMPERVEICRTDPDCINLGRNLNYCSKPLGANTTGFCKRIEPGNECSPGCPSKFCIDCGPYQLVTSGVRLECDTSNKCVISAGEECNDRYNICAAGTKCFGGVLGITNGKCADTRSAKGVACKIDCAALCPNVAFRCASCTVLDDPSCLSGKCTCYQCPFGVAETTPYAKCQ